LDAAWSHIGSPENVTGITPEFGARRRIRIVDGKLHETSFGVGRKSEMAAATGTVERQS
jgi:hypothetical protein